jgi:hypothetical protein
MRLIVWNSQGGKWDDLWLNWVGPFLPPFDDVIGLVVEAGWAPWVTPGPVRKNAVYTFESDKTWFNGACNTALCNAIGGRRRGNALWVPWVKDATDMTKAVNTRCSLGGVVCPKDFTLHSIDGIDKSGEGHTRPVVRVQIGTPSDVMLTILAVHLISGYPAKAQQHLDQLTNQMKDLIPQGTAGIVVGDMNIDRANVAAPAGWQILSQAAATQQSGGNLDWALLRDPFGLFRNTRTCNMMTRWKQINAFGRNDSDHAVMQYQLV